MSSAMIVLSVAPVGDTFANGGPVAWTKGTAVGGVAPKNESAVRLLREELHIILLPDLDHYAVKANPNFLATRDFRRRIARQDLS